MKRKEGTVESFQYSGLEFKLRITITEEKSLIGENSQSGLIVIEVTKNDNPQKEYKFEKHVENTSFVENLLSSSQLNINSPSSWEHSLVDKAARAARADWRGERQTRSVLESELNRL